MQRKALAFNLKMCLTIIFIVIIAVFSYLAPEIGKILRIMYPNLDYLYVPCLIFVWITAIPLVVCIIKAWKIAGEIGKDNTYCVANSKRLHAISQLILADVLLYCAALVAIIFMNLLHPAMYLLLTLLIFSAAVISVVASAASHYILRYREKNNME